MLRATPIQTHLRRTITVLPTSPDFNITVGPAAQEVVPGGLSTYTVTVTPLSGFTGTVNLSVGSAFPTGITSGGFSPPSISTWGLLHAHNANLDFHRALRVIADYHRYQRNDQPHGVNDSTYQFGASCGSDCHCRRCTSLALLAGVCWSKRVPCEASDGRRRSV